MTLTLTVPTWASIRDMFLLIVAYYSTLVHPQYDWWVFGICYYFGFLVALRSWWRIPKYKEPKTTTPDDYGPIDYYVCIGITFLLCLLWILIIPYGISRFFVTFGNKAQSPTG